MAVFLKSWLIGVEIMISQQKQRCIVETVNCRDMFAELFGNVPKQLVTWEHFVYVGVQTEMNLGGRTFL